MTATRVSRTALLLWVNYTSEYRTRRPLPLPVPEQRRQFIDGIRNREVVRRGDAPERVTSSVAALRLAVGDQVVYASHGIGHVESKQLRDGNSSETLTLLFDSGLKVTLPLTRAHDALRPLSGESELDEVRRTLRVETPPVVEPWSRRHRRLQAKLAEGSISGLAEIVRDGIHRERRRVKGGPAPVENQLYRKARGLLVAEIAAARRIELDAADAWISQQIC